MRNLNKEEIKRISKEVGFDACGIAAGVPFSEEEMRGWIVWLEKECCASMEYMRRRVNPSDMLEGVQSVIVCLLNYYPSEEQREGLPKIARYAYSRDYHYIMWEKLRSLAERLGLERYAVACDTMPVFDRALAVRAGLGWIGKNNMLVTREFGSYTFIGEVFTTLPLRTDEPMVERCGNCHRCVESCPTGALCERCIDARRCLSYRTIESKEPLNKKEAKHGWVFGCDKCQEVCPWNKRFAHEHGHEELRALTLEVDIPSVSNSTLRRGQSPLCRANISKLKENYRLCISNHQNS